MNKSLFKVIGIIFLSFLIVTSPKLLATELSGEGYVSTGTVMIPPGNLSLNCVDKSLNFGEITLSDKTQVLSKTGQLIISDYTTQFEGWNVQVKKVDNHWDDSLKLAINDKKNKLNNEFQPVANQLPGDYDVYQSREFLAYLTISPKVIPDNYSTKVIWSLVQGPES
ncbi:hypothetical protein [Vagococcus zengguangii]|uniref:Uncharacterized protein n=1 Tax=Vagococcus zengguangii TaxID=2571750 RepID=A0A4D7CSZ7_9ENTE|nr:hypothetical protein [Vagococcus zengguangii]QCI85882.1 hypothetical protein FA707_02385 [Vagococcus zengguangii]TLG81822.1 hypothetical protein FE258_01365 [Vagococcus zengguangii]